MKVALVVGIDYYEHGDPLYGCVNDAREVERLLSNNGDIERSRNFECITLLAEDEATPVNWSTLKDNIDKIFSYDADIALFYFAGHGHYENTGGYLMASDSERPDRGISLSEILIMANDSPARNKIIILDSCHSGIAGSAPNGEQLATLSEGLTILTASTKEQYADEENDSGVFTNLLVDALEGQAANLTGDITPGSIYAHIDQSLGAFEQRPVFKTNVKKFISIRKVEPPISLEELRQLASLFHESTFEFPLDPSYEDDMNGREAGMPDPDEDNTRVFKILQKYNRLHLVVPVGTEHMYYAAMQSKACKLTPLGKHYRRLAVKNRI